MNIIHFLDEHFYHLLQIFYLQVYKQKVKHLLYEHQNNISELKGESTVALKLAQDENRSNELDLRKDKRSLKVELKEQELAHEDVIKNLKKVRHGTNLILFYPKIMRGIYKIKVIKLWCTDEHAK